MLDTQEAVDFDELIDAGQFGTVEPRIKSPEFDRMWFRKGDGVRGRFVTIELPSLQDMQAVERAIKTESVRIGQRLRGASAYELVYWSSNGWDRSSTAVACDSMFMSQSGTLFMPLIANANGDARLTLGRMDKPWNFPITVLCVCVPDGGGPAETVSQGQADATTSTSPGGVDLTKDLVGENADTTDGVVAEALTSRFWAFDGSTETDLVRPGWLSDLVRASRFGKTVVILDGVDDLAVVPGDASSASPEAIVEDTFAANRLLVKYDLADGIKFGRPGMEELFRAAVDPPDQTAETAGPAQQRPAGRSVPIALTSPNGPTGSARRVGRPASARQQSAGSVQQPAEPMELPKAPAAALALLDVMFEKTEGSVLLIRSAELVLPNSSAGASQTTAPMIQRLLNWAESDMMARKRHLVVLLTPQKVALAAAVRDASTTQVVTIPPPSNETRRQLIAALTAKEPGVFGRTGPGEFSDILSDDFELDAMVRAAQGLSLRQIIDLFRAARTDERTIGPELAFGLKGEILRQRYGDLFEIIMPERGFENIAGLEHVKRYFGGVIEAIRNGDTSLVPMGVTLMGPPGTGKTAVVEALAREVDYLLVRIRNVKSKWVGESERQMAEAIRALRSLAPVVVFQDEADLTTGNRDSFNGDSGVSSNLMQQWMAFLSDPTIRGQVVVVNATNRPDNIDPALMRAGRSDENIPLLMPAAVERAAIFIVMFKRYGIATGELDLSKLAATTEGRSGAEIEVIARAAYKLCRQRGGELVETEDVIGAINDFIPRTNNRRAIDRMTAAAILTTSSFSMMPADIDQIIADLVERNASGYGALDSETIGSLNELLEKRRNLVA